MVSGISDIIQSLSDDLKNRVEAVVQLTEEAEVLQDRLATARKDLKRIKIALEALTGNDIPINVPDESFTETSPDVRPPEPPGKPTGQVPVRNERTRQGPECNSCGGEMFYVSRTLNNGKVVTLWQCSECSNERF